MYFFYVCFEELRRYSNNIIDKSLFYRSLAKNYKNGEVNRSLAKNGEENGEVNRSLAKNDKENGEVNRALAK